MIRVFVRHPVEQYTRWRKAYDEFDAERRTMGVEDHAVFQAVNDPNDVTVWHDFATQDKAKAFLASARLKEVMRKAGVKGNPSIWMVRPE